MEGVHDSRGWEFGTDRQREVLQAAYHGGYFESPKRATVQEIAATLGVSGPVFHSHLRAGERTIFDHLLDVEADDESSGEHATK